MEAFVSGTGASARLLGRTRHCCLCGLHAGFVAGSRQRPLIDHIRGIVVQSGIDGPSMSRMRAKPTSAAAGSGSQSTQDVETDEAPSAAGEKMVKIRRALVSVSDKTSLVELCRMLSEMGVEIMSTGGSAKAIAEAGIPVVEVADYTGFPEMMDGRLKTLNPKIHGGLLARRDNEEHMSQLKEFDMKEIDLVVVNLYPFEATVARGADFGTCVENVDIGGPTMLRAAAKNHEFVTVITDVDQYSELLAELTENDCQTSLALRRKLAAMVYAKTAAYDAAISSWFAGQLSSGFPGRLTLSASLKQSLRYGENPHQRAAFYLDDQQAGRAGVASAEIVQGKELSYNNISDTDAAFELVSEFEEPVVAIIKHANPCGVAVGVNPQDAYLRALACDPISAFGGIVAFNRTVNKEAAEAVTEIFTEVVIAPDATAEALAQFATKKNLRVLLTGSMPDPREKSMTLKSVSGGFLLQDRDSGVVMEEDLQVVTKRAPTEHEMKNLLFAWKVCKHVKSNAIVYAKGLSSIGAGAGQMSRVDSAKIAARKAEEASQNAQEDVVRTMGSVCASDAFFPFADGLEAVIKAGATAVIQPGGSKRDADVIAAADENNVAMVFTGMRHFRH
ncbi:Bifunctional purine biosynthesis protein PurH [Porphyridium purpureum]|uniref:Bifunctional purine biosynthesis protein PurH n=1 Tax=Porphyridium purpureum TaxID=35688 RepID=A0A5J4YNG5_PORPP|nr:Bifunctional purine biosynthesis protein PurH [Porphyridium purpureum]|eukprot:POR4993..scf295_9